MKELPYPDIDLSSIKGSSANVFPREFASLVMPDPVKGMYSDGEFHKKYKHRIESNFRALQTDDEGRRVNGAMKYTAIAFATSNHILPQYISKIASQDQNLLLSEEPNDVFLDQLERYDWYKK